ncbi:hypothetical protein PR048_012642 [Dryococelus australis]|uniref:Transposase n=1 Tax=Dryococelus australis TaxID=614101 RepID=A0ABQ9HQT0_9NEOP|nr:hypothetical protein PR048_012642 [Dryococelus australis]
MATPEVLATVPNFAQSDCLAHIFQIFPYEILQKKWGTSLLQQNGAYAHYAIAVREYLNDVFRNKWIGRGSAQLPAPLEWKPQSLDVSSCDNALWGYIKLKVASRCYNTTEDLKEVVHNAFASITPAMLLGISHST